MKKHQGFFILKTLQERGFVKKSVLNEIEQDIKKYLDEGPENDPDTLKVL